MELYEHQKKLLKENPAKWLMAWGTGSGKTRTAIELSKVNAKLTLVICPKSMVETWIKEIKMWGGDKNTAVVSKENFKKLYRKMPKFDCLIVDECHYFSNYKSQLTKSLYEYLKKYNPPYIYLLTATPYLSTPFNIYSLAKILGHHWNWYDFKTHFFYDVKMGKRVIPVIRKNIESDISQLVNKLGSTVRLEDCVDIPEQVYENEYFELTKEQKKEIEQLNDVLPIARINKIQQIEGGWIKGDVYVGNKEIKSEKLNRLLELAGEHKKIAVVCRFTLEINNIFLKLKEKYPGRNIYKLQGNLSGEERHNIIEEIHKKDDAIIIIQAQLCEGYSLETVPIMVFYSMDYSLKAYIQIIGRLQRISAIKKNVYIFFITKNSVGESVYDCVVHRKMDFNEAIYAKLDI
jgi:superfamily II DNA or RNA helicase